MPYPLPKAVRKRHLCRSLRTKDEDVGTTWSRGQLRMKCHYTRQRSSVMGFPGHFMLLATTPSDLSLQPYWALSLSLFFSPIPESPPDHIKHGSQLNCQPLSEPGPALPVSLGSASSCASTTLGRSFEIHFSCAPVGSISSTGFIAPYNV